MTTKAKTKQSSRNSGKLNVSRSAVVWATLDNVDASATLAQHAYVEAELPVRYIGGTYVGNKSLCGRFSVGEEEGVAVHISKIEGEKLNEAACCKVCRRIYERHFG